MTYLGIYIYDYDYTRESTNKSTVDIFWRYSVFLNDLFNIDLTCINHL